MKNLTVHRDKGLGIIELKGKERSVFITTYQKDGDGREYFVFNDKYYYLDSQDKWNLQ